MILLSSSFAGVCIITIIIYFISDDYVNKIIFSKINIIITNNNNNIIE